MQPAVPIAGSATDPHWTVEELLTRASGHDFHLQEWEVLATAEALVGAGRVRAIGRPCDPADQPNAQWEPIPAHAMRDLVIPLRPRGHPQHPGDMFWRGSGKRAYAFVQFNAIDLEREWLAELFACPHREAPADIVIPRTRTGGEELAEVQPAPEVFEFDTDLKPGPNFRRYLRTVLRTQWTQPSIHQFVGAYIAKHKKYGVGAASTLRAIVAEELKKP